jgi:hypothetical protein
MNKIYKIFGAAAILGLFMIGSTLTVFAAPSEVQPQVPPEPLGIIPADLYQTGIHKKPIAQNVLVDVINQGVGCAWMPWKMHIHVEGIANGDDTFFCYGPVFSGQVKTFESRICLAGSIPRYTIVNLDVTNLVFEGILGELNNDWSGFL